jgi:hypothetical protein
MKDCTIQQLVKSEALPLGKQVLLYEDFSSGRDFLDEDFWAPEGWQAVDNDGDGFNWYASYRLSEGDTFFLFEANHGQVPQVH